MKTLKRSRFVLLSWLPVLLLAVWLPAARGQVISQAFVTSRSGNYYVHAAQSDQGYYTYDSGDSQGFSYDSTTFGRIQVKYEMQPSCAYASSHVSMTHDTTWLVTSSNVLATGSLALSEALSASGVPDKNGNWIQYGLAWGNADSRFGCLVTVSEPTPFTLTVSTSPGGERPDGWGFAGYVTFKSDDNTTNLSFGKYNYHGSQQTITYDYTSGTFSGTLQPWRNYYLDAWVQDDATGIGPDLDHHYISYNINRSVKFTLQVGPPTQLPPLGALNYSTATPARSNNPWQFTVTDTNSVSISDLTVELQTTETPGNAASWQPLASLIAGSNVWTAQLTYVPAGNRYFRAVRSAPGCADSATAVVGPVTVQQGLPPLDQVSIIPWAVNAGSGIYPVGTWTFVLHQLTFTAPGLHARMQWSANPADANSWSNLSGGGELISFSQYGPNPSGTWELDTTNVPTGAAIYFRAAASAPGYLDSFSSAQGPYHITPPLPPQTDHIASDASLLLSDYPGANSGLDLRLQTTNCATLQLNVPGSTALSSALTLQGGGCGGANLSVGAGATLTAPRTAVAAGATLENQGTIDGTVSLISQDGGSIVAQGGGNIVAQGGGNIVAQGAGNMTHDTATAGIVAQGAGNIVAQGAGNIVAQGAGNIVAQGAGNIVAQGGGNFLNPSLAQKVSPALVKSKNGGSGAHPLDLTQPGFTGQMIVNGDYNQFAGTLIIGIAGTNTLSDGAQQYDQLVVHGTANLVGGAIAFGLFNPNDQTNQSGVFLPPDGATFDVVVASNIVVDVVRLRGLLWGDGQFFTGSVVTRDDGLQAVRLTATHVPPQLYLFNNSGNFQLTYATNYVGYAVESSDSLSSETNWSTFSFGTNAVNIGLTNASRFFRLTK